jgi:hypothetical protein
MASMVSSARTVADEIKKDLLLPSADVDCMVATHRIPIETMAMDTTASIMVNPFSIFLPDYPRTRGKQRVSEIVNGLLYPCFPILSFNVCFFMRHTFLQDKRPGRVHVSSPIVSPERTNSPRNRPISAKSTETLTKNTVLARGVSAHRSVHPREHRSPTTCPGFPSKPISGTFNHPTRMPV